MKTFANLLIALYVLGSTAIYAFLGFEMFEISMIENLAIFYKYCAIIAGVLFSLGFISCVIYIILWVAIIGYLKDIINATKPRLER